MRIGAGGSRCAGPGGSILGFVRSPAPLPDFVLTFRDSNGRPYTSRTDRYGIYELRPLPPDRYTLDSRLSADRYHSTSVLVRSGICSAGSVDLEPYSLTGRLFSGVEKAAMIELVGARGTLTLRGEIASDGRFYFKNVPPGDYFLMATFFLAGWGGRSAQVYYPAASDRGNAAAIRLSSQPSNHSFDFDPEALPLVPMPVVVPSPGGAEPAGVVVLLRDSRGNAVNQWQQLIGVPEIIPGVRGNSYGVMAFATRENAGDPDLRSALVTLHAVTGMNTSVLALIRSVAKPEGAGESPVR